MQLEWAEYRVKDLVTAHFSGPSPTCEERQIQNDKEWGLLKTTAITWDAGWDWQRHKVPPRVYWKQPGIEVHPGDVLITKAGPRHRVGVVVQVTETPPRIMVSGKMVGLRPDRDVVLPRVLAGALAAAAPQQFLDHRTTGMAESQVNFSNDVLLKTPVCIPPLPEQRRIAEILDTLDEAIRKTEQVIAKLHQMKQGLLHDLLTRGIDDNGELRDPDRHPEQFKDSPLGRIPKEWRVTEFGRIANSAVLGTTGRGASKIGRNIPLLKMGNLGWGSVLAFDVELVAKANVPDWANLLLRRGDLLFNTRNTPELVGKTGVWDEDLPEAITDNNILRARFGPDTNGFFVGAYMSIGEGRAQVHQLSTGTTSVAAIYWKNLVSYLLPLPPRAEQDGIVASIRTLDKRVSGEKKELAKLLILTQGLMDDLLTGRVRVSVPEDAAA